MYVHIILLGMLVSVCLCSKARAANEYRHSQFLLTRTRASPDQNLPSSPEVAGRTGVRTCPSSPEVAGRTAGLPVATRRPQCAVGHPAPSLKTLVIEACVGL